MLASIPTSGGALMILRCCNIRSGHQGKKGWGALSTFERWANEHRRITYVDWAVRGLVRSVNGIYDL